jgi:hypothetical protein
VPSDRPTRMMARNRPTSLMLGGHRDLGLQVPLNNLRVAGPPLFASFRVRLTLSTVSLLAALALGWLASLDSPYPVIVAVGGSAILLLALTRPHYLALLILGAAPFYFLIRDLLPLPLGVVWWDVLIVLLFIGWVIRWAAGLSRLPSSAILLLAAGYLLWGLLEVARSPNLLLGMSGFRAIFLPLLLVFPMSDVSARRRMIELGLRTLLWVGLAVALHTIAQSVLLNTHVISRGSALDTGRAVYMANHEGFAPSPRFGLERGLGPFPDPGQNGVFLSGIAGVLSPFALRRGSSQLKHAKPTLILVFVALVGTLSTWTILATLLTASLVLLLRHTGNPILNRLALRVLLLCTVIVLAVATTPGALRLDPVVGQAYSSDTFRDYTANLRESLLTADLGGSGLHYVPASVDLPGDAPPDAAPLGTGYFFLDDLVLQIGLVGVALLLALWLSAIGRSFRFSRRSHGFGNTQAEMVWAGLFVLFVASQHYGAPLIHGPDALVAFLLAGAASLTVVRTEELPAGTL